MGEDFYFSELKENLEKDHNGEYVVIEVESKNYFVDNDLLVALTKAKEKFPENLFHVVQIGSLQRPSMNYRKNAATKYAWVF